MHTCYTKPKGSYTTGKHIEAMYMYNIITFIYYTCTKDGSNASLYTCCWDGVAKENKQPNLTEHTRKECGSRKVNVYCISRMIAMKGSNGIVSVKYIRTHTNHAPGINELRHIPLPPVVREEVQKKYGQNVKLDSILDGMWMYSVREVTFHAILILTDIRGSLPERSNRDKFLSQNM